MDEVLVSFLQEITLYIIGLAVAFKVKHFLADFILQNSYMLGKFKPVGWVRPLMAHCGVHAFFTFHIILWLYLAIGEMNEFAMFYNIWEVFGLCAAFALFDFCSHFLMDFIKARPHLLGRYQSLTKDTFPTATEEQKRGNTLYWWAIGFDQMWHGISDLLIIWWAISRLYF